MRDRFGWILLLALLLVLIPQSGGSLTPKEVRSPCKIHYPSDDRIEWKCRKIRNGESLESLFGKYWQAVARFNRIDRRHAYAGVSIKVPTNLDTISNFTPLPRDYPEAKNEKKFILIDLSEQFLGGYEYGRLVFSAPVASGEEGNETPTGEFKITAADRTHKSSSYFIENTDVPYPMNDALRFHVNLQGIAYWIHGRDLPGYPASHGCIGLYDEAMQKEHYHSPKEPVLQDAKALYDWVFSGTPDTKGFHLLKEGARLLIISRAP